MAPRILFATTAGTGHLTPLLPFAHACVRAGHEVLMAGHRSAAPAADRAGLPFRPLTEPSPAELASFREGQAGLPAMQATVRAVSDLYIRRYAASALDDMIAAIADWRPDVVVRESAEFASLAAADRLGVPHVEVGIGLTMQADDLLPIVAPALDDLGRTAGLADRLAESPLLTMAPRSLGGATAPRRPSVHRFRQVAETRGPEPDLGWGDPEAPLVYLSFGTEVPSRTRDYFPRLYRESVQALAELPVRVLVAIGREREPAELGPVPSSVRVEQWVRQDGVMPGVAAMVGHGGAGSTLSALAAGVPMALLPLFADQPPNARRVADLGAGITVERAADVGRAVEDVLATDRYRDQAMAVAREIAALPPVDEAASLLEPIATSAAATART